MKTVSTAQAKSHLSELLGQVSRDRETILITRRGKPMAKLVPASEASPGHLADVEGWLDDDDPFFDSVERHVRTRSGAPARVLSEPPFGRSSGEF